MPSKNTRKSFAPKQYFHVYNRGVNKTNIFLEDDDKEFLVNLISKRLLQRSYTPIKPNKARQLENVLGNSEILCFCLMNNHYHFLFWIDEDTDTIKKFMQSIFTTYVMYFNKKYDRIGPLFQSRYKASRIDSDPYLLDISRYIHLNPSKYEEYKYSSYRDYLDGSIYPWVNTSRILSLFENSNYRTFLERGLKEHNEGFVPFVD